ncbi:MAG TPA: AmmeMemoRadiSam system protein B [Mycobacteriales bacterium]|nr:AmmeMemoRadiSam system protein B [Mycobacteriales bacterium]
MTRVRPPAAAGSFYSADAGELAHLVDLFVRRGRPPALDGAPSALVVPHAGYVYSGPVAATGYALLPGLPVRRVAILGPSHVVPLDGMAVPEADRWATPLGEVPVDRAGVPDSVARDDGPHAREHACEVQLPFVQRVFPACTVLPVAVGVTEPSAVADLLDAVTASPGTLVLVSTDLSHYHDVATARRLDRRTVDAVVDRDPAAIRAGDACGHFALRGLLAWARRRGARFHLLDMRTSADTAGEPRRVVGYAALALVADEVDEASST